MVYDPEGIAPCLCVGNHSGVEPKIIEIEHYEQDNRRKETGETDIIYKRAYWGGWMLNAYNQTYNKDCSFTITTRIDGANEHFITIDYGTEDNAKGGRQR